MKKLLASDIDGTLLHVREDQGVYYYYIDPAVFDAITEFRRQGNLFVLCTGRTLLGVKAVTEQFPLEADAAVLSGGGSLCKINSTQPLDTRRIANYAIQPELATEVMEYYYNLKDYILYWSDGEHDYAFADRRIHWMDENSPHYVTLEQWKRAPHNITNLGITPCSLKAEDLIKARDEARTRWEDKLSIHRNKISLDICSKGVNKGTGISRLAEMLSGENGAFRCYAVGDAHNDFPMFRQFGRDHSYLLETGEEELIPYVKKTVSSVAQCIEDILKE